MISSEIILEIWDVKITQEDLNEIIKKYPKITQEYQTQKRFFGNNMFSNRGRKKTVVYKT